MAIGEAYRANFETMLRAFENGDVALLECTDKATGKTVIALVAVQHEDNGDFAMVPLAKMFDGNPYEELEPPKTETEV